MPYIGKLILVLAILLMVAGCEFVVKHEGDDVCQKKVNEFMLTPSEKTSRILSSGAHGDCWNAISASNERLSRLNDLIASGNEWAARYILKHIRALDGGALEDSLVALGSFSEKSPEAFLRLFRAGELSEYHMKSALTMLPLELSDDLQTQLDLLEKRKLRLLNVSAPDLDGQKKIVADVINAQEAEIVRVIHP
jgi:hypothetical protein